MTVGINQEFEESHGNLYREVQHVSVPTNEWMRGVDEATFRLARNLDREGLTEREQRQLLVAGIRSEPLLRHAFLVASDGTVSDQVSTLVGLKNLDKLQSELDLKRFGNGLAVPVFHEGGEYGLIYRPLSDSVLVAMAPLSILRNKWRSYELNVKKGIHVYFRGQGNWLSENVPVPAEGFDKNFLGQEGNIADITGVGEAIEGDRVLAWRVLHRNSAVMVLTHQHRDIFTDWQNDNLLYVFLALVVGFVFTTISLFIAKSIRLAGKAHEQALLDLEDSEKRFRDFAENSSDWLWEMDADLRFTYFSERTLANIEGDATGLIGKRRQDLLTDEELGRTEYIDHLDDLANHRPFRNFTYSTKSDLGMPSRISISGTPVFDMDGTFLGYRGTGSDRTAEYEAERQVAGLHEQLVVAINTMKVGFVVYSPRGELLICNEQIKEMFPETGHLHVPGARFEDLYNADVEIGHADPQVTARQKWYELREMLSTGKVNTTEVYTESGRWIQYVDHITASGHLVGIREDITGRKQENEILRENFEHFRSLIEDGLDMITVTDKSGISIYESPSVARFIGGDMIGFSAIQRVVTEDQDKVAKAFSEVLETPVSAVESLLFRARRSLREILDPNKK